MGRAAAADTDTNIRKRPNMIFVFLLLPKNGSTQFALHSGFSLSEVAEPRTATEELGSRVSEPAAAVAWLKWSYWPMGARRADGRKNNTLFALESVALSRMYACDGVRRYIRTSKQCARDIAPSCHTYVTKLYAHI